MRIEALAMRWHAARMHRLAAQRSITEASQSGQIVMLSSALETQRADAKRIETRALRELAKACAAAKDAQHGVTDGVSIGRLPAPLVIDI